jgi:hypothetical protein
LQHVLTSLYLDLGNYLLSQVSGLLLLVYILVLICNFAVIHLVLLLHFYYVYIHICSIQITFLKHRNFAVRILGFTTRSVNAF